MTRAARLAASCVSLLLLVLALGAGASGGPVTHGASGPSHLSASPQRVALVIEHAVATTQPDDLLLDDADNAGPGLMPSSVVFVSTVTASTRRTVRAPLVARQQPSLTIRS